MKLRIYKTSNTSGAYVDLEVFNAQVSRVLNGNDQITFSAETTEALDLTIGATLLIDVGQNKTYHLNRLPEYEKVSSTVHAYTFTFEAPVFDLRRVAFLDSMAESDFFFCGRLTDFIALIVYNTNRVGALIPNTFSVGTVPDSDFENIQFNNVDCFQALNLVCDTYDYEYLIEWNGTGYAITLQKKIENSAAPLTFSYGKNNGLVNIRRLNVNTDDLITRLYYQGSNQNLPLNYSYSRLRGTANYIDQNIALFGLCERVKFFDEVKPEYQGTVTNFEYDDSEWLFSDTALPFNLTEKDAGGNSLYVIPGTSAKVNMLTGDCAGYSFDVKLNTYINSTRTWAVITYKHEDGYEVPNDTVKPAIGDIYALTDIRMPSAYVGSAVSNLDAEAAAYLALRSTPRVTYELKTDTVYASTNDIQLDLGDLVTINDADFAISESTRVIETTFPLFDRYKQTVKLSDVRFAIPQRKQQIEQKNIEIAIKSGELNTAKRILRDAKTTNELKNALIDPRDEYLVPEVNKPESLDPYMLAFDSGEPQFGLSVELLPNYDGNANQLRITGGSIVLNNFNGQPRPEIKKIIEGV